MDPFNFGKSLETSKPMFSKVQARIGHDIAHKGHRETYSVRAFHPFSNQDLAKAYHKKHLDILSKYDVADVGSVTTKWWKNALTYAFALFNTADELVGGARLEIGQPNHRLPVENAINELSPEITASIHELHYKTGEVCGAWLDLSARKKGLFPILIWAAIYHAAEMELHSVLALLPSHTKNTFVDFGFSPVYNKDSTSEYAYPDLRYSSTLMELKIDKLSICTKARDQRFLTLEERTPEGVGINYQLTF